VDEGRIQVRDEELLRRRRLAVLFRALLFVPQYLVLSFWSFLLVVFVPVAWLALLIEGRLPTWLHNFLAAFLRYSGQATAWLELLSGRYPDPLHTREHPFRIEIPDRPRQRRLITFFRLPLAVPAIVLSSVFRVILSTAAIGAWFVALALGRTTAGLQELGTFCLRYELETEAYLLLVTSRYPRLTPPEATTGPG
jgi:hypothetical protein